MEVQEYTRIKQKVETTKQSIERSKGAEEQILLALKEHGINSEEGINEKLSSLDEEIMSINTKISSAETDLMDLTDWASL